MKEVLFMRTVEQLNKHIAKCSSCKERYALLQYKESFLSKRPDLPYKYKVVPISCKSYFCPNCAKQKQREIIERFDKYSGKDTWRFLTLTLKNTGNNTSENLKSFSKYFNNFMTTIRKRYKGVKYLSIIEIGASGNVHAHILLNKYIWQPIASGLWKKASGSPVVFIEKVYNKAGCKRYVSKYVSKFQQFQDTNSLFYLLNVKRVSWSQNFEKVIREKIFEYFFIILKYSNIIRDILLHTSVINNLFALLVIDIPPIFHIPFFCPITTPLYPALPASKSLPPPPHIHTINTDVEGYF